MNLDETPNGAYIPKHIQEMTDAEYAFNELKRYYSGEALKLRVYDTLSNFAAAGYSIKEFDFCEDKEIIHDKMEVILVWRLRQPLQ